MRGFLICAVRLATDIRAFEFFHYLYVESGLLGFFDYPSIFLILVATSPPSAVDIPLEKILQLEYPAQGLHVLRLPCLRLIHDTNVLCHAQYHGS